MPKIIAIYPTDKQESTKFLNRINTYLKRKLNEDWLCVKLNFSEKEHVDCIEFISTVNDKFILFMGHGRSDKLFGSCSKESSDFVSLEAMQYNESIYKNENFINVENIRAFKDKILFSFSCNSNRNDKNSLGRNAILNGVKSFVGFGDIPTDYIDILLVKKQKISYDDIFPKRAIAVYKGLIIKIIKQSLFVSIQNNYTVQGLVDLIKIQTNKEMQNLILSKNKNRHKKILVAKLFDFKSEILILGNCHEKIVELPA